MTATPAAGADIAALYAQHIAICQTRAERALGLSGHDALLIAAGVEKYAFLDDRPYLFQPNPHFKAWLPLCAHPYSWLLVRPGKKPLLVYYQPDDYWHVPPAAPSGFWLEHVELRVISEPEQALAQLADQLPADLARLAIVGEADAALQHLQPNNPAALIDSLHWARACKTEYELDSMRAASRLATRAHLAARDAFLAGGSEAEIHRAYLIACGHTDRDLPYSNIVGLNEHAAVLHYQYQDVQRPAQWRSLLVDAGAQVNGYAADITRTWTRGDADSAEFDAVLAAMEVAQLALVDEVRKGVDYRDIHLSTHRHLARILKQQGIVAMSEEAMLAERVTSIFMPHGIGHLLGLQVHDVGGFMAGEAGGTRDKPEGHRYLRLTRDLLPGMVVTIEPGLYFIPTLLKQLRAMPAAASVDWAKVERLSRFGGIRIEDDVVCRAEGAPENLTRDAFALLG
ncbi:Xaa-Pro dipeptidase [Paucibacter sp. APW11]|uniref:Xaa-Pro dipeptidase n=1 Tax=Roseateles aquae TaxID=3077235 RepID=A0ABU3PAQ3_9BURK|nr:Xaa-Pro dipeptidase [Paucibacter sp. APW11]MDT8999664.1 Xaa-Pro dipeptidase [Paucibacter sp. APW11]